MSKAEDKALSRYPVLETELGDIYYLPRITYVEGYSQAEKDLELGWEDINIIRQIMFDYNRQIRNEMSIPNDKEYCEEILKRFKERKETKD